MDKLPESEQLPEIDNYIMDKEAVIKRYRENAQKFNGHLQKFKYINQMYYLGKQALVAMIAQPKYSDDQIIAHFTEVFAPAEAIFYNLGKLAELRFLLEIVFRMRPEKNETLLNFFVGNIHRFVQLYLTGGNAPSFESERKLVKYIVEVEIE